MAVEVDMWPRRCEPRVCVHTCVGVFVLVMCVLVLCEAVLLVTGTTPWLVPVA